jgi:hypothetical protein
VRRQHHGDDHEGVDEVIPPVVVLDPISDLIGVGTACDVSAMLTRQVDFP